MVTAVSQAKFVRFEMNGMGRLTFTEAFCLVFKGYFIDSHFIV